MEIPHKRGYKYTQNYQFYEIYFICRDGKKRNGVEVEIVKYSRSEAKNTLCIIEIDKVKIPAYTKNLDFPEKILNPPRAAIFFHVQVKNAEHGGEWSIEIDGICRKRYLNRT